MSIIVRSTQIRDTLTHVETQLGVINAQYCPTQTLTPRIDYFPTRSAVFAIKETLSADRGPGAAECPRVPSQ